MIDYQELLDRINKDLGRTTYKELAPELGIRPETVRKYLKGEHQMPVPVLLRLMNFVGEGSQNWLSSQISYAPEKEVLVQQLVVQQAKQLELLGELVGVSFT